MLKMQLVTPKTKTKDSREGDVFYTSNVALMLIGRRGECGRLYEDWQECMVV